MFLSISISSIFSRSTTFQTSSILELSLILSFLYISLTSYNYFSFLLIFATRLRAFFILSTRHLNSSIFISPSLSTSNYNKHQNKYKIKQQTNNHLDQYKQQTNKLRQNPKQKQQKNHHRPKTTKKLKTNKQTNQNQHEIQTSQNHHRPKTTNKPISTKSIINQQPKAKRTKSQINTSPKRPKRRQQLHVYIIYTQTHQNHIPYTSSTENH